MEYEKLLLKYEQLNDKEKNAILVYKSKLSYCINEIGLVLENTSTISEMLEQLKNNKLYIETYQKEKEILENPNNIFIKYSVFKDIDFSTLVTFTNSLISIYETINNINSITTDEELTLYRVVSGDNIQFLSKSELVSSSLSIDVCEKFLVDNATLYQLKLPKNSRVVVFPFSIKRNLITNKLFISEDDSQREIMFFKSDYEYEITSKKTHKMDEYILTVEKVSSHIKQNKKINNC